MFLKEKDGKFSTIRIMSFIMLGVVVYQGIFLIETISLQMYLITVCAAFCPKVIQRFAEKLTDKK